MKLSHISKPILLAGRSDFKLLSLLSLKPANLYSSPLLKELLQTWLQMEVTDDFPFYVMVI